MTSEYERNQVEAWTNVKSVQEKTLKMYFEVDQYTREDLFEACKWAKKTLTDLEGPGHEMNVTGRASDNCVSCSFAKASWGGDHSGPYMDTASEAVVMSVCGYIAFEGG